MPYTPRHAASRRRALDLQALAAGVPSVLTRRGTAGLAATALVAGGVAYAGAGATAEPQVRPDRDRPEAAMSALRSTPSARAAVASDPATSSKARAATPSTAEQAPEPTSTATPTPYVPRHRAETPGDTAAGTPGPQAQQPAPSEAPPAAGGSGGTDSAPTPTGSPTPTEGAGPVETLTDMLDELVEPVAAPTGSALP